MIVALQLGRGGSVGFPGKNTYEVNKRPMMEWSLIAAQNSKYIDKIFVSTDDDEIKRIARNNKCEVIDRPDYLCTKEALHQDAMIHGYNYISNLFSNIEFIVLLQCNAPFITSELINQGIEKLRNSPQIDSAATVSKYNMFSPARARRVASDGRIENAIPMDLMEKVTCDKDSMGDIYFTDGTFICRPRCFENIENGMLPYQWMGQSSLAIINEYGLDVDAAWQIPQAEHWLNHHDI